MALVILAVWPRSVRSEDKQIDDERVSFTFPNVLTYSKSTLEFEHAGANIATRTYLAKTASGYTFVVSVQIEVGDKASLREVIEKLDGPLAQTSGAESLPFVSIREANATAIFDEIKEGHDEDPAVVAIHHLEEESYFGKPARTFTLEINTRRIPRENPGNSERPGTQTQVPPELLNSYVSLHVSGNAFIMTQATYEAGELSDAHREEYGRFWKSIKLVK